MFQNNQVPGREDGPEFNYFFSELYVMGRGYRYLVWFRKWRFKPLMRRIQEILTRENIQHVIGVYPNPFYCLAACRAAKSCGVPFSSYFHNTYLENKAIRDPGAEQFQKEIFEGSKYIFVMSEGMQQFYEKNYHGYRFLPLLHTFDKWPGRETLTGVPGSGKSKYKLVAIGNFNESNLEATRRLISALAQNQKYELHIYTHVPRLLLRKRGLDTDLIYYHQAVRPEQIHQVLQGYDICVLTHGFIGGYGEIEYQTIFPTRTIPMLLSGKPIFAHSPPESFLSNFLSKYQCAELVNTPDEDAILEGLDRIAGDMDYQEKLVSAAQITAEQFYGPIVASKLKEKLFAKKSGAA
jgi:hypothetical protein